MCCRIADDQVPVAMLYPRHSFVQRCQGQLSQRRSAAAAPRSRSAAPSACWPGAALTCSPRQPRLLSWRSPCRSSHPACTPHQVSLSSQKSNAHRPLPPLACTPRDLVGCCPFTGWLQVPSIDCWMWPHTFTQEQANLSVAWLDLSKWPCRPCQVRYHNTQNLEGLACQRGWPCCRPPAAAPR